MFYHTCYLIIMPFYFYISYQRIIRQHLYINVKYIPRKTQQQTLIHSNDTTTYLYTYIIKSVFRCTSLWFNKIFNSAWHIIVKFFQDVLCLTYSLSHIFLHDIWLMSCEFPAYSRTGIPLHSANVQVFLELWQGPSSCIQIYPFFENPKHSHKLVLRSHNNRRHCRVWRNQNKNYHD